MLATNKNAVKPKIVLLGQKDPSAPVDLQPDEGPFESWLAVAQDMWGVGNLTPMDNVFASCAIGALAATSTAIFGTVCYHLGDRLFGYSREIGTWIDVFECESAVSQMQKRPKDKVKLSLWKAGGPQLGTNRFTKLAVLYASKIPGPLPSLLRDCASGLKRGGNLIFADLVAGQSRDGASPPARFGNLELHSSAYYRDALSHAGLTLCTEYDLTADVRGSILRGLYNSINMLVNIRVLKEPWKGQRLKAFFKELESLTALYRDIEKGNISASGLLVVKS